MVKPWTRETASTWSGPEPGINIGLSADGQEWRTHITDTTTLEGADGEKTEFTLVSGLDLPVAPRSVRIDSRSSAAAAPHFTTVTPDGVTVIFDTPPAAGSEIAVGYEIWL